MGTLTTSDITTQRVVSKRSEGHGKHDPAEYDVFRECLEYRQIILNSVVDREVVERVVMQIERINFEDEDKEQSVVGYNRHANPITIYINSPGGVCSDALAIVSAIEQSMTPVITVGQGQACSAAFLILAAGHARYAYRHCRLMYHQVSSGAWGTLADQVERLEDAAETQARIDNILLSRTHISAKVLAKVNAQKQDWYMWPEEAIRLGIIDGIPEVGLTIKKQTKAHYAELAVKAEQAVAGGARSGK